MLETGIIAGLGLIFTLWKLSWKSKLWVLSHPLLIDVVVFVLLMWLHAGTHSGVMTATVGALMCSMVLGAGRWAIGYIGPIGYVCGHLVNANTYLEKDKQR